MAVINSLLSLVKKNKSSYVNNKKQIFCVHDQTNPKHLINHVTKKKKKCLYRN